MPQENYQIAFETWVTETNPTRRQPYSLTKGNCGWYLSERTEAAWDVWKIKREPQHHDDEAVDCFAAAMKEKLALSRAKGRGGWQFCEPSDLSRMLREHVEKGDPRDVANFCMFLWTLGQPIAAPAAPAPKQESLGAEFEQVLHDNLPKLYVEDPATAPAAQADEREALTLLREFAEFTTEINDHSPKSFTNATMRFGMRAFALLKQSARQQSATPAEPVPQVITQWRDAWQAHNAAVDTYNARVAFARANEGARIGSISCQAEYELMHDAKNKVYRMLPGLFAGIESLLTNPADAASEADKRDAEAYRRINTPEITDFLAAVHNEALHQRERWGADGDAGKTDADWFWLLGYLGGKAMRADNVEKLLHHIITTAAACLNWHGARVGHYIDMRPGIADPEAIQCERQQGAAK